MRIRILESKRLCVLAIALTALLLVIACAPPTTPTGQKVVKIGALPLLTGGGASADTPSFQGIMDYVSYFNEEEGIPGVSIEVVWRDVATEVGRWMSQYLVLAELGIPVIYTSYPAVHAGIKPQLAKDQIVLYAGGVSETSVLPPPGWIFAAWCTQGEEATAVLDYFMESWKEQRPPKLQFLCIETEYGREPAAEATKYAEGIGFEVLPLEVTPIVVIDATVQLVRIQERQPDLVYVQHVSSGAGPIMRDVERLGLHDQMQFAGSGMLLSQRLIDMAPASVEGFLAPRGLPWIDETNIPGIKTMLDMEVKYRGQASKTLEYPCGWVYGATMCEAVKRAGEELGYDNIDGPAVKSALESMKDFDAAGIVTITFGPEDRRGSQSYAVYQVQGGKILRVTEWRDAPILVP